MKLDLKLDYVRIVTITHITCYYLDNGWIVLDNIQSTREN